MQHGKILVVEDDPTLQFVARRVLAHLGYDCVLASSGEEAAAMDMSDILLVFMDVGLPGIDGAHATMLIREKELRAGKKRVPIVALTAHSARDQCAPAGMDDFLQKPALMDDIQKMLVKYVQQKNS